MKVLNMHAIYILKQVKCCVVPDSASCFSALVMPSRIFPTIDGVVADRVVPLVLYTRVLSWCS